MTKPNFQNRFKSKVAKALTSHIWPFWSYFFNPPIALKTLLLLFWRFWPFFLKALSNLFLSCNFFEELNARISPDWSNVSPKFTSKTSINSNTSKSTAGNYIIILHTHKHNTHSTHSPTQLTFNTGQKCTHLLSFPF